MAAKEAAQTGLRKSLLKGDVQQLRASLAMFKPLGHDPQG
jgi:hypothetical protein